MCRSKGACALVAALAGAWPMRRAAGPFAAPRDPRGRTSQHFNLTGGGPMVMSIWRRFEPSGSPMIKSSRRLLPLALLLGVAACVINLNFDIPRTLVVDAPLTSSSISQTFPVDLSQQSEVQQHKDSIDSLNLDSLDLVITNVDTTVNTVTSIQTGTVSLRPDGATDATRDVPVGTLTNFAITANNSAHLKGSQQLDSFLLSTVKGSGKFSVVVSGTTTGSSPAKFTLTATLHAAMGYNTGIF
jgi:hypothetical protein